MDMQKVSPFVLTALVAVALFVGLTNIVTLQYDEVSRTVISKSPTGDISAPKVEVTADWKTFATSLDPASSISIRYPKDWGISEIRFPCDNKGPFGTSSFGFLGPIKNENSNRRFFIQFCVNNDEYWVVHQGFVDSTPSSEIIPKIVTVGEEELKKSEEYNISREIIKNVQIAREDFILKNQ